jgi:hypothetical protein
MSTNAKRITVLLSGAALALIGAFADAHDTEHAMPSSRIFGMREVSLWLESRFTEAELEALGAGASRVEAHACGCSDRPRPHFPYRVVLFVTPKGDLVARAEAHESALKLTPLAVRKGIHYYELDAEERAYGAFAHPCEFTDFRFGPQLSEFFPSCKARDEQSGAPSAAGSDG